MPRTLIIAEKPSVAADIARVVGASKKGAHGYESEGHIPGVSIDDLIIDYLKCSENEDSAQLIIGAIDKDSLRKHLDIFKDTGLDPARVEIDETALATSFHVAHEKLQSGKTLLLNMEAGHTDFVIIENGRIVRLRSTANQLLRDALPALPTAEEMEVNDPLGEERDGNADEARPHKQNLSRWIVSR